MGPGGTRGISDERRAAESHLRRAQVLDHLQIRLLCLEDNLHRAGGELRAGDGAELIQVLFSYKSGRNRESADVAVEAREEICECLPWLDIAVPDIVHQLMLGGHPAFAWDRIQRDVRAVDDVVCDGIAHEFAGLRGQVGEWNRPSPSDVAGVSTQRVRVEQRATD